MSKLDKKISKLGNNLLSNVRFGTRKKFSKLDMWKMIQYKKMLACTECGINKTNVQSHLNEFLNENLY